MVKDVSKVPMYSVKGRRIHVVVQVRVRAGKFEGLGGVWSDNLNRVFHISRKGSLDGPFSQHAKRPREILRDILVAGWGSMF